MENVVQQEVLGYRRPATGSVINVGARRPSIRFPQEPSRQGIGLSKHRKHQGNGQPSQLNTSVSPLRIKEKVFYDMDSNLIKERQLRVTGTIDYKRAMEAIRKIEQKSLKGMQKKNSRTTIYMQDSRKAYSFIQ